MKCPNCEREMRLVVSAIYPERCPWCGAAKKPTDQEETFQWWKCDNCKAAVQDMEIMTMRRLLHQKAQP